MCKLAGGFGFAKFVSSLGFNGEHETASLEAAVLFDFRRAVLVCSELD